MADRSRSHARVDSRAESAVAGGVMFVTDSCARTERAIRRAWKGLAETCRGVRWVPGWVGAQSHSPPPSINNPCMHAAYLQCSGLEPVVVVPNKDDI